MMRGSAALLATMLSAGPLLAAANEAPALAAPPAVAAPVTTEAPVAPAAPVPAKEAPLGFEPEDFRGVAGGSAEGLSGAWAVMVKALVALAAVLMVIYLLLGKGLARIGAKLNAGRTIKVVDRVGLDPRRTLYLVEIDGVRTLVGASEQHMTMMVLPTGGPGRAADFAGTMAQTGRNGAAAGGSTTPTAAAGDPPVTTERGDA